MTETQALLAACDDAAAEQVLAEAVRTVPEDPGLAMAYAERAEARGDWPEAIHRWSRVLDRFELATGVLGRTRALLAQGRLDEAEAELSAARRRFPLDEQVAEDHATLAETRGRPDLALDRWSELRREFPRRPRGYQEAARLLRARGEATAADALEAEGAVRAGESLEWPTRSCV